MDTIRFPVQFKNGITVKVVENTDAYWAQFLAMLVRINNNELVLEPTYGVNDPVFSQIDAGRIKLSARRFYPEVDITTVNINQASIDGTQKVKIDFSY